MATPKTRKTNTGRSGSTPRTRKRPKTPKTSDKDTPPAGNTPPPAGTPAAGAAAPAPAPSRPFLGTKIAVGGTVGYLTIDQLLKRYGGKSTPVQASAGAGEVAQSGGSTNVSMNEPAGSTDVGTDSNPSQEEVPFWVKNQAYMQKEVDRGTGSVRAPDGGSATEFQNQYINSQLRDANSPFSQALARMNQNTASARQAANDRESIKYGNVPVSSQNRAMLNDYRAYTNSSPSKGSVGNQNMSVNTSTPLGANAANPNSPIQNGGARGANAPLGMGMQSFSVPQTPPTRADIERNMSMAGPVGPNLDEMPPEVRARIQAESAIVNATNSAGEAIKGAAGRAVNTAKDVLSNAASYIPAGMRGGAGPVGSAGGTGGEDVNSPDPEELQSNADRVLDEREVQNKNFAQHYADYADNIAYGIETGDYSYDTGVTDDLVNAGFQATGDLYAANLLGQSPALVKNAVFGQYGAKSAAAMGRNETARSVFASKEPWKQTGKAIAESYAKGSSTVSGLARAGGTAAMRTAGKVMPYYSLIDAAYSGGEELLSDNGVRSTYHGGGARGKAMGTGAAILNGLTMGAYDTIGANYGPSDFSKKNNASKDPLGTAWLTEQFYNKFIK